MIDFMKRFVGSLSEAELEFLITEACKRRGELYESKVQNSEYPVPTTEEMELYKANNRLKAIKEYRDRTGTPILATRRVFEATLLKE